MVWLYSLGSFLTGLRVKAGVTQKQLQIDMVCTGFSKFTAKQLAAIEEGRREPSVSELVALLFYLDGPGPWPRVIWADEVPWWSSLMRSIGAVETRADLHVWVSTFGDSMTVLDLVHAASTADAIEGKLRALS